MPSPIVQIRIPQELLDQAKAQAEADRRSFSAWVRLLIEDRLRFQAEHPKAIPAGAITMERDMYVWEDMSGACGELAEDQASVAQAEPSAEEDAGSRPARRAGKGSPAPGVRAGAESETTREGWTESPSRKPKACKHTNQIRKLGAAFCTDCGEFV